MRKKVSIGKERVGGKDGKGDGKREDGGEREGGKRNKILSDDKLKLVVGMN